MPFKRTENNIIEISDKINKLIEIYAEKEDLLKFLIKPKGLIDAKNIPVSKETNAWILSIYRIDVTLHCKMSKDTVRNEFYNTLSSFVSDTELEDQLAARYFPDYLTIKNIFSILLYEVPRKVTKEDLELLNDLYKKYNMKF